MGHKVCLNPISYLLRHNHWIVSIAIRRGTVVLICVFQWGHIVLFTVRLFVCGQANTVTPLSVLFSCRFSFSVVDVKILSVPNFALKSPNKLLLLQEDLLEHLFQILLETVFFITTFLLGSGMCRVTFSAPVHTVPKGLLYNPPPPPTLWLHDMS